MLVTLSVSRLLIPKYYYRWVRVLEQKELISYKTVFPCLQMGPTQSNAIYFS